MQVFSYIFAFAALLIQELTATQELTQNKSLGAVLMFCWGDQMRLHSIDAVSGAEGPVVNLFPKSMASSLSLNIGSSSVSTGGGRAALGVNGGTNYVVLVDYASPTPTVTICAAPKVSWAGSLESVSIDCVADVGDKVIVIYHVANEDSTVASLDRHSCKFHEITKIKNVVQGSRSGPGGQCVALPALHRIYFVEEGKESVVAVNFTDGAATISNVSAQSDWIKLRAVSGGSNPHLLLFDSPFGQDATLFSIDGKTMNVTTLNGSKDWSDDVFVNTAGAVPLLMAFHFFFGSAGAAHMENGTIMAQQLAAISTDKVCGNDYPYQQAYDSYLGVSSRFMMV